LNASKQGIRTNILKKKPFIGCGFDFYPPQNSAKKMRNTTGCAIKKPTPAFQTKQTQTTKKECINYDGYIMMNVFLLFSLQI
jgi:hypothetical protein